MLGLAAGVMIAASFWSLLAPAIEMSEDGVRVVAGRWSGFCWAGVSCAVVDRILPHLHPGIAQAEAEGIKTTLAAQHAAGAGHHAAQLSRRGWRWAWPSARWRRASTGATLAGAIALAIGIGLQNFPEGTAVAMPLRREGLSQRQGLLLGAAVGHGGAHCRACSGAWRCSPMRPILPYALAFAAGAMIFVVVEELIPEAQAEGNTDLATMGAMLGFAVMMIAGRGAGVVDSDQLSVSSSQ